MSRVLVYLGRFAAILTGFVAAVLAASLFCNLLVIGGLGWADVAPVMFDGPIYVSVALLAALFGYHAFPPAMAAILLAEFAGFRDWLFHALAGAGVAAAAMGLAWREWLDRPGGFDTGLAPGLVACGMVGGIAYWLVAGRSSGLWLRRPDMASGRGRSGS